MRRAQQAKLLELVQTLKTANTELYRQDSPEVLCGLLADMQDFTFQIIRYIESVEGKGTKTTELLDGFCKILYMAYCERSIENYDQCLNVQLINIENMIYIELKPNRLAAAFFPHNASMADSLQSIWEAAMADPVCDVTICPIPWFERSPDGTLGEMHDESDAYPKDLPLADWREYDVEAYHPDIIFICSPYDEWNYVTSVHPDFYCERLKKCTDMLVYSPYFVVMDDVPELLCVTSASIYANKTIVQSEAVCNTYIRVFEAAYGKRFGDPKEKFVPLGSPKFDKVIATTRENCELPETWSKIVAGKRAVFFNTSINAILRNSEMYLDKLQNVLSAFREREDVVLWWRPHPLSESTFDSMRPLLADTYRKIVKQYKQEAYGIYDDSPELHRAIAWTDAYYGDRSSVAALYETTGKKVVIQSISDMEPPEDEKERMVWRAHCLDLAKQPLTMEDLYFDGKYFWFSTTNYNSLFKMNRDTWKAEWIGMFPNEELGAFRLYSSIAYCNGKLYFCPLSAKEIAVYNLSTNMFSKIPFDAPSNKVHENYQYAKFYQVVATGDCVYFLPYYYDSIICFNTITGVLTYHGDWRQEVEQNRSNGTMGYFCSCTVAENRLIAPSACSNRVLVFDIDHQTSELFIMPNTGKDKIYSGISYDGAKCYVMDDKGNVFIRKFKSHNEKVIQLNAPESQYDDFACCPMAVNDHVIYALPNTGDFALALDTKRNELTKFDGYGDEKDYPYSYGLYWFAKIFDGCLYTSAARTGRFIRHNLKSGEKNESMVYLQDRDALEVENVIGNAFRASLIGRKTGSYVNEPANCGEYLTAFLDYTASDDYNIDIQDAGHGSAGRRIYEYIKNEVMGR